MRPHSPEATQYSDGRPCDLVRCRVREPLSPSFACLPSDSLLKVRPGREHSLMPFWFWNDELESGEIVRQIGDFQAHGVDGFVIHPRVGLPRRLGWMSRGLLDLMRVALEEARRRGMIVILYDDGMYPSGSASGQVVAADAGHACRCLDRLPAEASLPALANEVAVVPDRTGRLWRIIDRPVNACLRGLHYRDEADWDGRTDPAEDEPPAADILNPEAVQSFIRLVYQRYADEFSEFIGNTVIGVFTDEPGLLGRCRERNVQPGTTGILPQVARLAGRDLTPHLNALWDPDEPQAAVIRAAYRSAVRQRCEETYYRQISEWCTAHGLALCGHPGKADDLGQQRWFHVPGQDLVWRWVLPGHPSALEGEESTQGKCSSSAAAHLGRRFNSNECFGAYGHSFDEREMEGLANWCFVRGVNRLYPHAFYYSVRGPRRNERPPDVGPNSPWWGRYRRFADACRWLSWLLTDSRHVCQVAVLGLSDHLPWGAAKVLSQNQIDFNYLEVRHLWEDAEVDGKGIRLRGFHYRLLVVDALELIPDRVWTILAPLIANGRVLACAWDVPGAVRHDTPEALVAAVRALTDGDVVLDQPEPDLRVRHMVKAATHVWLLANEGFRTLEVCPSLPQVGEYRLLDPWSMTDCPWDGARPLRISPASSLVIQQTEPEAQTASCGRSRLDESTWLTRKDPHGRHHTR